MASSCRFLSHSLSLSLSFDIQSYTDIDRVFRLNDHKSTSGFVSFLAPTQSLASTKQLMVSCNSIESKCCCLASVTIEIIWIKLVLKELYIPQFTPPLVWYDNHSAAARLATNPTFHAWPKHIEFNLHFIYDKVLKKYLIVHCILSSNHIEDIFTKHFPSS